MILPDILAEEVMKGFTGNLLMSGTGAIVMNPGLQATVEDVGNTVTVPYFEDIGEAEQVPENGAGSLDNLTQSSETATVVRFFKGVSMTMLAQIAKNQGRDLMDVAVEKLRLAFVRGLDTLCLSRALSRAASASMEHDGTAANVSTTSIVETLKSPEVQEKLKAAGSLERRFAKLSDLQPLWVPPSSRTSDARPKYSASAGKSGARAAHESRTLAQSSAVPSTRIGTGSGSCAATSMPAVPGWG